MNNKIAVIGCGKQAPKHIKGLKDNGVKDIVLFDVNQEAANSLAEQFDCEVAINDNDIFTDSSINAVDICTPVHFHKKFAEQAIKSNKSFFCEKPLTTSLEDDKALAKLAEENNSIAMVGYIYRFAPALNKAKDILDNGDLGNIHTALFRIGGRGNHMKWKHQKATGGGALSEMAVHMIDLAYWYFGEISEIEVLDSDIRLPDRKIQGEQVTCDAEDYLLIKLKSKSGVNITIIADFVTPAFFQYIEIQGDNGSFNGSIQPNYKSNLFLIKSTDNFEAGANALEFNDNNLFKFQFEHFIGALNEKRKPVKCTLDDSVAVMEIAEKIRSQL